MEKWPNLFIVGAPKAGTTSLYMYLSKIPGIYMCPLKEPRYFSQNTRPDNKPIKPIHEKEKYLKLFEKVTNEKIVGEASTSYLANPETPKLIHEVSPEAHIIISLRDPVERIYTSYLMGLVVGKCKHSFHKELEVALKYGPNSNKAFLRLVPDIHSKSVERYLQIFGHEQVKILIFEEWTQNIKQSMEEILKFLGINESIIDFEEQVYNPNFVPRGPIAQHILENNVLTQIANRLFSSSTRNFLRSFLVKKTSKPKMNNEDRKRLVSFYSEDVKRLQNILGRKLPWENFRYD